MKPSLRYPKTVILLGFWVGASVSRSQSYKPKTGKCQNNAWRRVSRREWGRRRQSHLCSGMNRIWNYSCAEKQTNTSCINMTLIVCVCVCDDDDEMTGGLQPYWPEALEHARSDALTSHHADHPDATDAADGRLWRCGAAPSSLTFKHQLLSLRTLWHGLFNHPVPLWACTILSKRHRINGHLLIAAVEHLFIVLYPFGLSKCSDTLKLLHEEERKIRNTKRNILVHILSYFKHLYQPRISFIPIFTWWSFTNVLIIISYLLYVLSYETPSHFLVIRDKEEGFGLWGTLGLHLLEAEVIVHHLPDLLNLRNRLLYIQESVC